MYLNVGKLKGSHLSTKVIRKLILIILDLSQYYLYPMKIFEKIVHDQVSVFVKENSYLYDR